MGDTLAPQKAPIGFVGHYSTFGVTMRSIFCGNGGCVTLDDPPTTPLIDGNAVRILSQRIGARAETQDRVCRQRGRRRVRLQLDPPQYFPYVR